MNSKRVAVFLIMTILSDIFNITLLYNVETIHVKTINKKFRTATHSNNPGGHDNMLGSQGNIPSGHGNIPVGHDNILGGHSNISGSHANIPKGDSNTPEGAGTLGVHGNISSSHGNIQGGYGNIPSGHGNTMGGHHHGMYPSSPSSDGNKHDSYGNMADRQIPDNHGNNTDGNVSTPLTALQNKNTGGKMTSDTLLHSSKDWIRKCRIHKSKFICLKLFVQDNIQMFVVF